MLLLRRPRLAVTERDPLGATTRGTGEMIKVAIDGGARRITLGADKAYEMRVKYFIDELKEDPALQVMDWPFGVSGLCTASSQASAFAAA